MHTIPGLHFMSIHCPALCLIPAVFAVATILARPSRADDVPAIVQALDVGVARWRESVTFLASYRFRQGVAKRYEDGVAGNFYSDMPPNSIPGGSGQVAKTASAFRFTFKLDSPPVFDRRTMTTKMVSADFGAANGIVIQYWPAQIAADKTPFGGVFEVSDGAKGGVEQRYPDIDHTIPMPVLVCGTNQAQPFLSIVARSEFRESVHWEVRSRDTIRTVLQVTLTGMTGNDSWSETRTYAVRIDAALPLIESIGRTYSRNGKVEMREQTEASDFVDCGMGCIVPSRVVVGLYDKPLPGVDVDENGFVWWIRVWESDDVGRQPPGPESFVYTLPEKTRIRGLTPVHSTKRMFDLTAMGPDNLDGSVTPGVEGHTFPAPRRANWVKTSLALASLLALIGGGLCLLISAWRRRLKSWGK